MIDNPFVVLERQLNRIENLIISSRSTQKTVSENISEHRHDQFIDQKQVSELLGISTVTVWEWEKKEILKSYRIGNLKRFKLSEILEAPKPIRRSFKPSKVSNAS